MELRPPQPVATKTEEEDMKRRKHGEWQKWLQFDKLDDDVDVANLEKECRNLVETWKKFQDLFPGVGTSDILFNEYPSIDTLRKAVRGAVEEWEENKEKGVGKARIFLTKYCDTLLAHSQLFSIIPQGDKYTSVFTGVVSSLVKALAEISDKMSFSRKQSSVYSNDKIRELVIRLYIRYFRFLCLTMKWFSSKRERFWSSIDQSYIPKNIQAEVKDIKGIAEGIQNEVDLEFRRDVKESLEQLASSLGKATPDRPEKRQVTSEQNLLPPSEEAELVLGDGAVGSLPPPKEGVSEDDRPGERRVTFEQNLLPTEEVELVPASVVLNGNLDAASQHLEPFHDRDPLSIYTQASHPNARQVPSQVFTRLQRWMSSTISAPLWVMGRPLTGRNNSIQSMVAARVVLLAGEAKVPCIWYICRPPVITSLKLILDQKQKLFVSMVYSLIRQLCQLVPIEVEKDFEGLEHLAELDGSPQSIPIALSLLKGLLDISPHLMICVIDGLQLLGCGELVKYVDELLEMLTGPVQDHVGKLLVTTSGSFTSGAKLGATARLDCSVAPARMRGRDVPGGRSMHNLRL
ncbi:hypothetical protein PG984_011940 [Apiospora sp. TS-2023a]